MSLRRKDKHAGSVKFMMELKPFTETANLAILDPQLQSSDSLAVFSVTIKYCQDLPLKAAKIKCTVGSTSFVKQISDDNLLSTRMSFLVRHLHNEKFVLLVQQKSVLKSGSNELGRIEIPCSRLLDRGDRLLELFSLDAAVTGKVMLELSLRTVQYASMPVRKHMEGLSQIGILRCRLKKAAGLPNIERFGKSDPYVGIMIDQNGQRQTKTSTYKANNLNPEWNECFEFVVSTLEDTLHFTVQDHGNNAFRDSVLGEGQFDLAQLTKQANVLVQCELELAHPSKRNRTGTLFVDLEYKPFLEENPTADAYKRTSPWSSGVAFLNITDLDAPQFNDPIFSVECGKDAGIKDCVGGEVSPSRNVPFNLFIGDLDHSLKISVSDRHVGPLKRGLAAVGTAVTGIMGRNPSVSESEALFDQGPGSNRVGVCEANFERILTSASKPSEPFQLEEKLQGLISGRIKVAMIVRIVSADRTGTVQSVVPLGEARPSALSVLGDTLEHAADETRPDTLSSALSHPDKATSGQDSRGVRPYEGPADPTDSEGEDPEDELKAPWVPTGPGTLTIEVVKCENLPAGTTDSQANPYVSIRLRHKPTGRVQKDKTKTKTKTRSPRYGQSGGRTVFKIQNSLLDYEVEVVVKHRGRGTFRPIKLAKCDKPIHMPDGEPIDSNDAKALDFGVEPPPGSAFTATTGEGCKYRLTPSGFVYLKVIDFEAVKGRAIVETAVYEDDVNTSYASSSATTPDRGRPDRSSMAKQDSTLSLI
jgi:hypothetical protein